MQLPAFPDATSLADVFDNVTEWKARPPGKRTPPVAEWPSWDDEDNATTEISPYLSTMRAKNVKGTARHVTPKPEVVDWIKSNMLACRWGSISFELVDTLGGTQRLFARYSQIIGSRLLAEWRLES